MNVLLAGGNNWYAAIIGSEAVNKSFYLKKQSLIASWTLCRKYGKPKSITMLSNRQINHLIYRTIISNQTLCKKYGEAQINIHKKECYYSKHCTRNLDRLVCYKVSNMAVLR